MSHQGLAVPYQDKLQTAHIGRLKRRIRRRYQRSAVGLACVTSRGRGLVFFFFWWDWNRESGPWNSAIDRNPPTYTQLHCNYHLAVVPRMAERLEIGWMGRFTGGSEWGRAYLHLGSVMLLCTTPGSMEMPCHRPLG